MNLHGDIREKRLNKAYEYLGLYYKKKLNVKEFDFLAACYSNTTAYYLFVASTIFQQYLFQMQFVDIEVDECVFKSFHFKDFNTSYTQEFPIYALELIKRLSHN